MWEGDLKKERKKKRGGGEKEKGDAVPFGTGVCMVVRQWKKKYYADRKSVKIPRQILIGMTRLS